MFSILKKTKTQMTANFDGSFVSIQNPSKQSDLISYGRIGLAAPIVLQTVAKGGSFVLIQNQII